MAVHDKHSNNSTDSVGASPHRHRHRTRVAAQAGSAVTATPANTRTRRTTATTGATVATHPRLEAQVPVVVRAVPPTAEHTAAARGVARAAASRPTPPPSAGGVTQHALLASNLVVETAEADGEGLESQARAQHASVAPTHPRTRRELPPLASTRHPPPTPPSHRRATHLQRAQRPLVVHVEHVLPDAPELQQHVLLVLRVH